MDGCGLLVPLVHGEGEVTVLIYVSFVVLWSKIVNGLRKAGFGARNKGDTLLCSI